MPFRYTDEQRQIQQSIKTFVSERIQPVAGELDRNHEYPASILDELGEMGIMGMTVSDEYGGLEYDLVTYALIVEELASGLASVAGAVNTHLITATILEQYADDRLRTEFLPQLVDYNDVGAFALTESNAGSDNAAMETRAERAGDEWSLSGEKRFVTNALNADYLTVFAKTGPETDKYRNISAFLVPVDSPGVSVTDPWETLGFQSIPTCDIYFDNVQVPSYHLIGDENMGFMYVVKGLNIGRISHASRSVGIARAALKDATEFSREREQFGQSIGEFQGIKFKIADMAMRTDVSRLLTHRAADLADRDELNKGLETSMAKVVASETAVENALEAIQIHGGVGYTKEYDVERYLRDAKLQTISEGTNEIQRRLIADRLIDV